MKGLELSELFYIEKGVEMIQQKFPRYESKIAVGLVGEGSECFGFDDEISRDHDWGPSFCLWLDKESFEEIGSNLNKEYLAIASKSFNGYEPRSETEMTEGRVGAMNLDSFYKKFIGTSTIPNSVFEWKSIPEEFLATATNGKVFIDPLGKFTSIREGLLSYYPQDVWLKKLSAKCAKAAQAGQYNYPRSLSRGAFETAYFSMCEFLNNAISIVYILNKKYKPFYKWAYRGLLELEILGETSHKIISEMIAEKHDFSEDPFRRRAILIEQLCSEIVFELYSQELTNQKDPYLLSHCEIIQSNIQNEALRTLHIMSE